MRKKLSLIASILLVLIIVIVFGKTTMTFYQQDEWLGYGLYLAKGTGMILQSTGSFWGMVLGQGRILANLFLFLFYKLFSLNVFPIAIFAITFHIVNTLLVFLLAKKLFKRILPAFLGSLFFALSSVSQSAITWPAASINTLPSTTLILIALTFYFKYLESFRGKWMILSFAFVYLSLFFKETGVSLFLLLPLFSLIYKQPNPLVFIKRYWYFLVATFLIVTFRIWGFKSESGQVALFLTGSSKYFFDSLVARSILYPLTSFSLSIVPPDYFLNFARYITNVYYPLIPESQFILVAQTVVLDFLATILSMIIVFISLALLKITDFKVRKTIIFWLIFLPASFLPYIIISKNYSYLESRYYYLASAAWAMIFAWVANLLSGKIKLKYVKAMFLITFVLFLYVHAKVVVEDVGRLINESQTRISILNQISALKPKLDGNKNVFYVTGDADYYLPGNRVPFQHGFGYTLMSLYYGSGKIPNQFLEDHFLFEIGSQGYKEEDGNGFGYFSDKKTLEENLKKGMFTKNNVINLHYNSFSKNILEFK